MAATLRLADSEQVGDRMFHGERPIPVLPSVSQVLVGIVATNAADKDMTWTRADHTANFSRSASDVMFSPHNPREGRWRHTGVEDRRPWPW